jgi:hypothetical protein
VYRTRARRASRVSTGTGRAAHPNAGVDILAGGPAAPRAGVDASAHARLERVDAPRGRRVHAGMHYVRRGRAAPGTCRPCGSRRPLSADAGKAVGSRRAHLGGAPMTRAAWA